MNETTPRTFNVPRDRWVDVSDLIQDPEYDYRAGDLNPGTFVSVTYKGDNFTVYVVNPLRPLARADWGRYIYEGERFKSLSAVARRITGDPTISGNRFFKLRRRKRGKRRDPIGQAGR